MRIYVVQQGDSPAKIAIGFAGCPKCAADLIDANPQKAFVTLAGGFRTFRDLRVGEELALPEKWFDGTLDRAPKSYFDKLPAPPQGLGDQGVGAPLTLNPGQTFAMTVSLGGPQGIALEDAVQGAFSTTQFIDYQNGLVGPQQSTIDLTACYVGSAPLTINPVIMLNGIALQVLSVQATGTCTQVPIHLPQPVHVPQPFPPHGGGGQPPQPNPPHQGAGVFTMTQGHRIQSTAVANGPLPSNIASETVQSLQAQFDSLHPGQYHVVSVSFPASNQVNAVADYCGPTTTVPSPSQSVFGGVTVQFTYLDLGLSPAGTTCAPSSSSSSSSTSSTGTIVAVGAAAVGLGLLGWLLIK